MTPNERLRYHVTGAIERGEATPIVAVENIELVCLRCAHEWEADIEPGWEAVCPVCGESDYIPRSIGA